MNKYDLYLYTLSLPQCMINEIPACGLLYMTGAFCNRWLFTWVRTLYIVLLVPTFLRHVRHGHEIIQLAKDINHVLHVSGSPCHRFFSMVILLWSEFCYVIINITSKFCTCHDSTAVILIWSEFCYVIINITSEFCTCHDSTNEIILKLSLHLIRILTEKNVSWIGCWRLFCNVPWWSKKVSSI